MISDDEEAGEHRDGVDLHDALPKINNVLTELNTLSTTKIRVVILGCLCEKVFFKIIAHLLKEWKDPQPINTPRQNIHMEFVTNSDPESVLLNFCHQLCIEKICAEIEYFNARNYYPFGSCKHKYL